MAAGKLDHQPALARALVIEPQQVVFREWAQRTCSYLWALRATVAEYATDRRSSNAGRPGLRPLLRRGL